MMAMYDAVIRFRDPETGQTEDVPVPWLSHTERRQVMSGGPCPVCQAPLAHGLASTQTVFNEAGPPLLGITRRCTGPDEHWFVQHRDGALHLVHE